MRFHESLTAATAASRNYLLSAPLIGQALQGRIARETYLAFLVQAYHHVRHTVPLMMAVGSRLPDRLAWLRKDVLHYLEEEDGHDEWILNDIAAAGGDRDAATRSAPSVATDAMVAYAYDMVSRRNPVGFFGMVHVLEGTSASLALHAADSIAASLGLPARAFTYLRSHGQLDQEHTQHLAGILDRLDDDGDRAAVVQCAHAIYWLYGNMFRSLEPDGLGRARDGLVENAA
jgi:pyrroloquinoline quinone (PQQ) biosynthesis protein C